MTTTKRDTALYLTDPKPVWLGAMTATEARDLLRTMTTMGVRESGTDTAFARGWRSAVEFLEARLVHLGSDR